MVSPANSWERQPDEAEEWYSRFLVYLGLGPGRTLLRAYRAFHPESKAGDVSGSWRAEAKLRSWARRCNDHDIPLVREQARESIVHLGRAMRAFSRKTVRALLDKGPGMRPATWEECAKAFEVLWKMFPPQTIHAVVMMGDETADGKQAGLQYGPDDLDADGFLKEIPEPAEPSEAQERAAREWRVGPIAGEEMDRVRTGEVPVYRPERYVEPSSPSAPVSPPAPKPPAK